MTGSALFVQTCLSQNLGSLGYTCTLKCYRCRITLQHRQNLYSDQYTIEAQEWMDCWRDYLSQLMRLWYLTHRCPAKVQVSLRIHTVSPEPSLFAHMKYGNRERVPLKIRHLAPLNGCACAFEE